MALKITFISLLALVVAASAQQPIYAQCGGIGFNGGTSCVSGTTCQKMNDYYSQCLPGAAAPAPTQAPPTQPTQAPPAPVNPAPAPPGGTVPIPAPPAGTGLNAAARKAGKLYFGSATDNNALSDTPYLAVLNNINEVGQITPANSMKWDATEPSRGNFQFTKADQIANLAKKNAQLLRGHNCVWHSQLPSWVSSGGFNSSTLTSIVQTHCSTVVSRYKGQIYSWDVVNEVFNEDGTFRSDVFYNTLNTQFITTAFNAARAADPSAKLYINDYNTEGTGAKATGLYNLVKQLKSSGVPVDGVGFQAHFTVNGVPSTLKQNLQRFIDLGVEVAITELDIRMPTPASQANLNQQQKDYQNVIGVCKSLSGCVGVTVWDISDKYSWVPSTFSGQGAALPWDNNMQKKPAYNGILAGFQN